VDEAKTHGMRLYHLEMQHCGIPPFQVPYADCDASTMSHSARQHVCVGKPFALSVSMSWSAPHIINAQIKAPSIATNRRCLSASGGTA
jgi:hypothetical protein